MNKVALMGNFFILTSLFYCLNDIISSYIFDSNRSQPEGTTSKISNNSLGKTESSVLLKAIT